MFCVHHCIVYLNTTSFSLILLVNRSKLVIEINHSFKDMSFLFQLLFFKKKKYICQLKVKVLAGFQLSINFIRSVVSR